MGGATEASERERLNQILYENVECGRPLRDGDLDWLVNMAAAHLQEKWKPVIDHSRPILTPMVHDGFSGPPGDDD